MGLSDAIERLLGGAPAPNVSTASQANGHSDTSVQADPGASGQAAEATNGGPGHPASRLPAEGATATDRGIDPPKPDPAVVAGNGADGDASGEEAVAASTGPPPGEPLEAAVPVEAVEAVEAVTPVEVEPTLLRHVDLPLSGLPADETPDDPVLPSAATTERPADVLPPDPAEQRIGWEPTPPAALRAATVDDTFPAAWSPPVEDVGPGLPDEPPIDPAAGAPLNGAGHAAAPEHVPAPPGVDAAREPTDLWPPSATEPAREPDIGPSAETSAVLPPLAVASSAALPPPPVDIVPAPYEWDEPIPAPPSGDAHPIAFVEPAAPELPAVDEAPPATSWEPVAPERPAVDVPTHEPLVEPVAVDPTPAIPTTAPPAPGADAADTPARPVPELPPVAEVGFEQLEATATIVESLGLGYHLGSAIERIVLSETRGIEGLPSLREAVWLIERHIELAKGSADAETLAAIRGRLVRNGDVIAGLQALSVAVDARRSGGPVPAPPAPPAGARPAAAAPPVAAPPAPSRPAATDQASTDPASAAPEAPTSLLADALRRTPPGAEHDDVEDYPLGREILVMAVRFGLILVVIVVVVLVITLAATLT